MEQTAAYTTVQHAIDIELTNACNSNCSFCPRDNMPGVGMMTKATLEKAVARAHEHTTQPRFRFCGNGDCLLDKNLPDYVRLIHDHGAHVGLSTNGNLLSREKSEELLDAGLDYITFNISDRGEKYEEVYGLDFTVTQDNIKMFTSMAKGRCDVRVALVMHDDSVDYDKEEKYWRARGIRNFVRYPTNNRSGAIFDLPERSEEEVCRTKKLLASRGYFDACMAPFYYIFIGWDGYYYLCANDWRKKAPVGHIDTHSIAQTMAAREEAVASRKPICSQCTSDPVNRHFLDMEQSPQQRLIRATQL